MNDSTRYQVDTESFTEALEILVTQFRRQNPEASLNASMACGASFRIPKLKAAKQPRKGH